MKHKVSVCIATYNGEKYIKEQVESILCQLNEDDEIIISDDNSTDETIEAINSINDGRVIIFVNTKGKGYTRNFENALEKASGDVIFLSDQDDVWVGNKIAVSLNALEACDFVVHDAEIVDRDLNVIDSSVFHFRHVRGGFFPNFVQIKYLGCCMVFKKEVLNKALPFPNNQKLATHDSWLTLVAEMYFKVLLIKEPLIRYRRHGNNVSLGGANGSNTLIVKLIIRLYSLYYLLKIFFR